MLIPRLIEHRRDGGKFTLADWMPLLAGGSLHPSENGEAALLRSAIGASGMTDSELVELTRALLDGAEQFDRSGISLPIVDLYCSGGLGDKSPLILAPLVSSLGVAVLMLIESRFEFSGGTLNKLRAIPGFRTQMSLGEARTQLRRIGCVIAESSNTLAPQSLPLYAYGAMAADAAGPGMMAAGIISRKISQSLSGLVADVTFGPASLFGNSENASTLAAAMKRLASEFGCRAICTNSAQEFPMGRAVGACLELEEAILVLQGEKDMPDSLMRRVLDIGCAMLSVAGVEDNTETAREMMRESIDSGRALRQFGRIIEAQGGNPAVVDDPGLLPQAGECEVFRAPAKGFVTTVDGAVITEALHEMGISFTGVNDSGVTSGFMITVKSGDWVDAGEAIATVFAHDSLSMAAGQNALARAINIAGSMPVVRC